MNWILSINYFGREKTWDFEGTEQQARARAIDCFEEFTEDYNLEYENEIIPSVCIVKVKDPIIIDMSGYYIKQMEEREKYFEEQRYRREKEEFERLQKKFGNK